MTRPYLGMASITNVECQTKGQSFCTKTWSKYNPNSLSSHCWSQSPPGMNIESLSWTATDQIFLILCFYWLEQTWCSSLLTPHVYCPRNPFSKYKIWDFMNIKGPLQIVWMYKMDLYVCCINICKWQCLCLLAKFSWLDGQVNDNLMLCL